MDFENMNIWCWLIPLLVGVICGILGYYWGRGSVEKIDHSSELKALRDKNASLKSDLDACNKKLTAKPSGSSSSASTSASGNDITSSSKAASIAAAAGAGASGGAATPSEPAPIAFDAAAAKAAFGKTIKKDDLKVVEGIGPKIEQMFHDEGIKTWAALSETPVARCQEILNKGGERYKVHDPSSWPMQAKMCYENKWKELVKWQEEHDHGKL